MMYKWPKIGSFHNIRELVINHPELMNNVSSIGYKGKIKLHGTNAAIQLLEDYGLVAQSRNKILTLASDNVGFAQWVEFNRNHWLKNRPPNQEVIVFGEFCGSNIQRGVAVSQIPSNIFAVFAAQVIGTGELIIEPKQLERLVQDVPNTYVLPWATDIIDIKWLAPGKELCVPLELINELVAEVEQCDPWVKEVFGIEGIGEGIVFYPVTIKLETENFGDFAFKAKGEKHRVVKTKLPVQLNAEIAMNARDFAELVLTEARLEQGAYEVGGFNIKNTSKFINWISEDVMKETENELKVSNLTWKLVNRPIKTKASNWFVMKCQAAIWR